MDRCVRCGAELGVGRFCLNCGHRIGEPAPAPPPPVETATVEQDVPEAPASGPPTAPEAPAEPVGLPVQAADPTPVPPATPVAPVRRRLPAKRATKTRPESDWDPREELLPYEEVDDPERDDPLTGRTWIAWVVGAALLIGLVVVLLDAFGSDPDDGTATDPSSSESAPTDPDGGSEAEGGTGGSEVPTGVGKRMQLATRATFTVPDTAPPTTDFDGNLVAYEATQMHDGNPSSTWRMAGDASGETISITLAEPAVVQRIGLVNGYTKLVAGVDWYPNNRRILGVTWTFEDGSTIDQTFAERPGMQVLKVPPVQTSTVELTITSVTPPGSGNLGRDYTAISEVSILGRRAG